VVELLLTAGADPTMGCKAIGMANTALHQAVVRGDAATVRLLLRAATHLDVSAAGQGGLTPLCLAARGNQVACARALLEFGADPNAVTPFGRSALALARINHRSAILQLFGADVDDGA
jgi:ankyrin repeat protein